MCHRRRVNVTGRIGIFGGTFDPIHIAHLVAASVALHEGKLDRVLLMVANDPWQKTPTRLVSSAEVRFRAVKAALSDFDGLEASRIEIDRGGPSYTVETLSLLAEQNKGSELCLIGGVDSIATLETWHRPADIARLASILVVDRPGSGEVQLHSRWRVAHLEMPSLDISSTALRTRLSTGKSVDILVPKEALAVYRSEGLYS